MPYRRLPNTDQARLRALNNALEKAGSVPVYDLAFSQKVLIKIRSYLPTFTKALYEYKQAIENYSRQIAGHNEKARKARLYVSHFVQVLNLSVIRGEIRAEHQSYYDLEPNTRAVPDISTDALLIEWGQKIIEGESKRVLNGGTAIYTPSIAKVKINYEEYLDIHKRIQFLQNNITRHQGIIAEFRVEADQLIAELWNEVEERFGTIEQSERRLDLCRNYGVVYYYRRGEKNIDGTIVTQDEAEVDVEVEDEEDILLEDNSEIVSSATTDLLPEIEEVVMTDEIVEIEDTVPFKSEGKIHAEKKRKHNKNSGLLSLFDF